MMPGPQGLPRFVAALATLVALSACTQEDRDQPLEQVEPIDIPAADTTTRTNFNISNPTLEIPTTFPVGDGDLLTLVWSDEFDSAKLDPETWFFESGDGSDFVGDGGITGLPSGWGNNELQWYLPDNAQLENGVLKITARRETVGDFGYTSARITTRDRFAFKYGRIEASIKFPSGQGLWPAFW
ncbi:MAG TPA: glycoside hydrolase family 16 protein, partial [Woeseiaceae bacterium]|nr:glycoside hydrolase family 16 protein [Woeseiaceae bacterium]